MDEEEFERIMRDIRRFNLGCLVLEATSVSLLIGVIVAVLCW